MLYLVRWPDLSACIVRARNEEHLDEILDELSDPSDCTWSRYDGPLWIEFELDVRTEFPSRAERNDAPLQADQIKFDGVEAFARACAPMRVLPPDCDTTAQMSRAVLDRCFPKLSRAIEELHASHEDLEHDELDRSELAAIESALLAELETYIRGSWQASARLKRDG